MVNVDNLDEFCGKALALYEDAPQQVFQGHLESFGVPYFLTRKL
jgi:hypothetical protein